MATARRDVPLWKREFDLSWLPPLREFVLRMLWPATSIVALLSMFPWPYDDPDIGPDYSFLLVLHKVFGTDVVFGRELIVTFGPWGFLYGGYEPSTRWVVIVAWVVLSQLLMLGIVGAVKPHAGGFAGLTAVWSVFAVLSISQVDVRMFIFAGVLLAISILDVEAKRALIAESALAIALGWLVAVKFTIFAAAVPALIAHSCERWAGRRRFSPVIPLFLLSLMVAAVTAGQPITALWDWIATSFRTSAGYRAAGRTAPPYQEVHALWLYVSSAGITMLAIAVFAIRRMRWRAIFPLVSTAVFLGIVMKATYVRHDTGHHAIAPLTLLAFVLILAPPFLLNGQWPERALFATALLMAFYSASSVVMLDLRRSLPVAVKERAVSIAGVAMNYPSREADTRRFHERKLASVRGRDPLPLPLATPVDVYSYRQAVAYANNLALSSRPAFQSYFACPVELAEANARHLTGPKAPATVLFAVEPIDDRYPTFEDSLSWRPLLTHYEPLTETNRFLLLKRRSSPATVTLSPLGRLEGRLGKPIHLPRTGKLVWARVTLESTAVGKLYELFLRPPEIVMLTQTDTEVQSYRFVRDFAEMGFLLSPVTRDHHELRRIVEGVVAQDRELRSFTLTTGSHDEDVRFFQPVVIVELWELSVRR